MFTGFSGYAKGEIHFLTLQKIKKGTVNYFITYDKQQ